VTIKKELKMKNTSYIRLLPFLLFFVYACGGNKAESGQENTPSKNDNAYEGSDVKIEVVDFDKEKSVTNVILYNGLDKAIRNISGKLVFIDADGNEVTFATGASKASPFQRMENPYVVDAKSKKAIRFNNKIDAKTESISVIVGSVETADGEKIDF
jgi:hypothetical protein